MIFHVDQGEEVQKLDLIESLGHAVGRHPIRAEKVECQRSRGDVVSYKVALDTYVFGTRVENTVFCQGDRTLVVGEAGER